MQLRLLTIYMVLIMLSLASCHKDSEDTNEELFKPFTAEVYQEVGASLIGYVYNENNEPVADATVAIYSATTKTNKWGVFSFKNVKMDKQGTYIKVIKNGYILGSDYVYPIEGAVSYSYVKMAILDGSKTFESNTGGNLINGGGKVTFDPGTMVNSQGVSYNGKVYVASRYLHPEDKDLDHKMPGRLIADAANGNTVILGTLGMIGVELRDKDGNELNLKSGTQATLEFPVVTSYRPKEIELWSFDESKGRWKEEGKAILSGDKYIAKVSHFSFWNCDAPFPLVEICGKVVNEDGSPATNMGVQVSVDGLMTAFGTTNSQGEFCGKMPKGKKLTFGIGHTSCDNKVSEFTVGPFENKTQLDDIKIKDIASFKIQGKLTCSNAVVKNGILLVKVKQSTLIFETKEDGSFAVDIAKYLCGESIPVTALGFDNNSSETSANLSLTPANSQNLNLNVCASPCDFTGKLVYNCTDKISVEIAKGSGNFKYTWDDKTTNSILTINKQDSSIQNKTYCVTVTDVSAGCEKVFCTRIGGRMYAGIEGDCAVGKLVAFNSGGVEPFKYKWSNGSTERFTTVTNPDTYCVTITDADEFTLEACQKWVGTMTIDKTPSSCNKNSYSIGSSPFIYGRINSTGVNFGDTLVYPIKVDVFKTGFKFSISIWDNTCKQAAEIKLPQLVDGLATKATNTTCDLCADGKIEITVKGTAECFECKTGAIKIFNIKDTNVDLSDKNTAGQLPRGEYYVVVRMPIKDVI